MKLLVEMFVAFFRVGLFTFGGGYAMLPIVDKEIVAKKGWVTSAEVMDYYGIAQVSMGLIAMNTSALIGYRIAKKTGAVVAAFSAALPSIIIITLIALFLEPYMTLPWVSSMFSTIRIVVAALIVDTTIKMGKQGIIDIFGWVSFIIAFGLITFLDVNPIPLILFAAISGNLFGKKVVKA